MAEESHVILPVAAVPKLFTTPLPDKSATVPVNDRHGAEETKAGEHIAIRQHCTGVGVRPLMPPIEGTDICVLEHGSLWRPCTALCIFNPVGIGGRGRLLPGQEVGPLCVG